MISIIIPVFNTSWELLNRCLLSIKNQSFQDYEIIIVNDGSTIQYDFSSFSDDNFIVISSNHVGVSAARNKGIAVANGEYLAFVDSDDEITPCFLSESMNLAIQYSADFVVGAIQCIDYDGKKVHVEEDDTPYPFLNGNTKDVRRSHLGLTQNALPWTVLGSPCGRLFKKSLFKRIGFDEDVLFLEDQLIIRKALLVARNVVYLQHIWYYYYQYKSSSLHSVEDYKDIAFHPAYLREWNSLNIVEPDLLTRSELCKKSIHYFSASLSQHVIPMHISIIKKMNLIHSFYKQQSMHAIVQYCDIHASSKRDKGLFFLIRHRLLFILYLILSIRHMQRRKNYGNSTYPHQNN